MAIIFNEKYFNEDGYSNYKDYLHFVQRAKWINTNLSGNILEIGCGYGYLLHHLNLLGKENFGIDGSIYVESKVDTDIKAKFEKIDIKDYSVEVKFGWCVSWNVLDCLVDEVDAIAITTKIKTFATNQFHVICMSGKHFTEQGYFIRDYAFWRNLLPDAYLIDYGKRIVYVPNGRKKLSNIPLCWGMVSD